MTTLRALPILLFLAACGGEAGPSEDPGGGGVVIQKAAVSGDAQSGVVADTLAAPVAVLITADGVPVAGRVVVFTALAGSGSMTPGTDTTGADGIASAFWILGNGAGARQARAASAGASGSPVAFTATATPGPAASLLSDGGQDQAQETGAQFALALVVRVIDAFGNNVPGVVVAWAVTAGDATLSAAADTTASNGRALVAVTAGDSFGGVTVSATVPSTVGSPVQFSLTVTPTATPVSVSSNSFSPATIDIPVGGAVKWNWISGTHNVTQQTGPAIFPSSPSQDAGSSFGPVVFDVAGVYTYECSLHSGMTGTINVGVASAPRPGVER